jgi:competence protein ComEA
MAGILGQNEEVLREVKLVFDWEQIDRRLVAAAAILIIVFFFIGMKYGEIKSGKPAEDQALEELAAGNEKTEPVSEYIQVYVTGQVAAPRVVKLKNGARVFEAVEQVELLPEANIKSINMARVLQDGEPIVIPGPEAEMQSVTDSVGTVSGSGGMSQGLVNINTADVSLLDEKLPGIGPALAQRIVDYRTANGSFAKIEDIKNVSGIGDKKFEDLKNLITVR